MERENTASPNGVGIHHPAGDEKKISTYSRNDDQCGLGRYPTPTGVLSGRDSNGWGVTEGGSSGSPLFNNNGLIIGTLTGGAFLLQQRGARRPDPTGLLWQDELPLERQSWRGQRASGGMARSQRHGSNDPCGQL